MRTPVRGLKAFLKKTIHLLPWVSVDGAIGATDFVRQRLITCNGMPAKRCYVAPNGLPPMNLYPVPADLHRLFNIPAQRKVMVMTGRAHRYKGIQFILECIYQMNREAKQKLHFLFVGEGPDLELFVKTADRLGVSDQCSFVGNRDDIPSLLEGADFAIHASQGEVGYSLSVLEYMRAGLPVVVPDNPSVCGATVHELTGMIYAEGNILSAISMIEKLVFDENLRKDLGARARNKAQQYSLQATHEGLLGAFEKIDRKKILTIGEESVISG
jgi:glycosyltransferase involved in cell wall biosynthesis